MQYPNPNAKPAGEAKRRCRLQTLRPPKRSALPCCSDVLALPDWEFRESALCEENPTRLRASEGRGGLEGAGTTKHDIHLPYGPFDLRSTLDIGSSSSTTRL